MTPEEKADELIFLFLPYCTSTISLNQDEAKYVKIKYAQQCALICINEMLDLRNQLYINEKSLAYQYLLEVKTEIENL